jgi:hypothetical protein
MIVGTRAQVLHGTADKTAGGLHEEGPYAQGWAHRVQGGFPGGTQAYEVGG